MHPPDYHFFSGLDAGSIREDATWTAKTHALLHEGHQRFVERWSECGGNRVKIE
jgi:hypothetical protein